ncbi:MAG: 1-acyl-sn-glycerol-3-phosphate acyltransferase [Treponema sp.]|nr:1-acyl-sn-glycerol-3-phosphate acyltransferase [Treponema sp.]
MPALPTCDPAREPESHVFTRFKATDLRQGLAGLQHVSLTSDPPQGYTTRMETLNGAFQDLVVQALQFSKSFEKITNHNVYQQAIPEILPLLDKMSDTLLLPGSGIGGFEHLDNAYAKAVSGKSCVLLLEHYSNLDLPIFSYLLRKEGERGKAIAGALVAIAGMKLSEENPAVAAFTAAFTRIVIYPSRSLMGLDARKDRDEIIRSNSINRAAMKSLLDVKKKGKLILVFPSGTRYRPWNPETKRGVREIDSYIKSFDYMCPVAINGEVLHVRQGDMMDDFVSSDVVRMTAGPVLSCAAFREKARAEAAGTEDKKQATVDAVMRILEDIHRTSEPERENALASWKNSPYGLRKENSA